MFQMTLFSINILDGSGNPVTEQVQSVVVTDASGNPVTGKDFFNSFCRPTSSINIDKQCLIKLKHIQ